MVGVQLGTNRFSHIRLGPVSIRYARSARKIRLTCIFIIRDQRPIGTLEYAPRMSDIASLYLPCRAGIGHLSVRPPVRERSDEQL
jgi:hypothetical protein